MNDATNIRRLREALSEIARIAGAVAPANPPRLKPSPGSYKAKDYCTLRSLPQRLQPNAAQTARQINPVNRPSIAGISRIAPGADPRLSIAVLSTKYWGPQGHQFTVSFLDATNDDFRRRVLSHMNAWSTAANVSFVYTEGRGQVRISLAPGGYWSYLGTDILHIAEDRPTMNLEGFSMNTSESEYKRVVRHETGHTLGFPHEHMRGDLVRLLDPEKAYAFFGQTQGWSRHDVDLQVLTPLDDSSIFGTPVDQDSIMCYQLPGSITRNGQPIRGGIDINDTDYGFAGKIYPNPDTSSGDGGGDGGDGGGGGGDFGDGGGDSAGNFLEVPLSL